MSETAAIPEVIPFDRYTVTSVVNTGASVLSAYAYDLKNESNVFIKAVNPEAENAPQRMLREANVLESLTHPRIPRLLGVENSEDFHYIVTEPMRGTPYIAQWLRKYQNPALAARLCLSALEVLEYVHESGFTHRDIKPGNEVMQWNGSVSLIDFELALHHTEVPEGYVDDTLWFEEPQDFKTRITALGCIAGTPMYMAPEHLEGKRATPQSDVYAMGTVLYELLNGVPPFYPDTHNRNTKLTSSQLLENKLHMDADRLWRTPRGDVPEALQLVVATALEPALGDRYASAAEMGEDIRRHLSGQSARSISSLHVARELAAPDSADELTTVVFERPPLEDERQILRVAA